MTKILFLYSELAGYFLACVNELARKENVQVKIVRWAVNKEAPFQFQFDKNIEVLDKDNYDSNALQKLCFDFQPNIIYSAGWMDKDYLKIARKFKQQGLPVIAGVDSPWRGNLKQKIASWIAPFYIKPYFTHIWGAGIWQYEFARKLGFDQKKIMSGLYCADLNTFLVQGQAKQRSKTMLYVGRFLEYKGVQELYDAFQEIIKEQQIDWTLRLIGNGPLKENITPSAQITVEGFIQPDQLAQIMQTAGAFVLPSHYEPWGVVVHEAVAAGCPMIVSDGVSAGTAFVKHGYNGFTFKAQDKASLKSALLQMIHQSNGQLDEMGKRSTQLALQNTPQIWAETLLSVVQ